MKNGQYLRLFVCALGLSAAADVYAEAFEYEFVGELELEDISCKSIETDEIDYTKVSTHPFSAYLYGNTDDIEEMKLAGYGTSYKIPAEQGVIRIDTIGSYIMSNPSISSQISGNIGFGWNETDTLSGHSIIFYGTSRYLNEEVEGDLIYFNQPLSTNPTFRLNNNRTYRVIASNDFVYSANIDSGAIRTNSNDLQATTLSPCFDYTSVGSITLNDTSQPTTNQAEINIISIDNEDISSTNLSEPGVTVSDNSNESNTPPTEPSSTDTSNNTDTTQAATTAIEGPEKNGGGGLVGIVFLSLIVLTTIIRKLIKTYKPRRLHYIGKRISH